MRHVRTPPLHDPRYDMSPDLRFGDQSAVGSERLLSALEREHSHGAGELRFKPSRGPAQVLHPTVYNIRSAAGDVADATAIGFRS